MSAWTRIAHTEVGSGGQANIEFTSIPQTYTDLCLTVSGRFDGGTTVLPMFISFNGTAYNSARRQLFGNGSTTTSFNGTDGESGNINGATTTANTFGNIQLYIPNYTVNANKSFSVDIVTENNATTAVQELLAGLWSNTAAITSITLDASGTSKWVQYSSATLYGITKGSSGGVSVS